MEGRGALMRTQVLEPARSSHEPLTAGDPEDFADRSKKFTGAGARRVLVVDKDSLIRWAIGESLRAAGYAVIEGTNLTSAIRSLGAENGIALVFLESCPPDASDMQVWAELRRRWPRLPVVLMSDQEAGELRDGSKSNAITILSKPFDMGELESVAEQALGRAVN
jgi:DNA-binding NtrC family response regulator